MQQETRDTIAVEPGCFLDNFAVLLGNFEIFKEKKLMIQVYKV